MLTQSSISQQETPVTLLIVLIFDDLDRSCSIPESMKLMELKYYPLLVQGWKIGISDDYDINEAEIDFFVAIASMIAE